MLDSVQSWFNPLRITIPFLIDIIIVSDPNQIKQIESSGEVDRLHFDETKSLPWWIQLYFPSTKFYDKERDLWFCPFESSSNPTYLPRRTYLEEKTATGYSTEDVRRIAQLLRNNASDDELAHEMVQVVNQRFFNEEIPSEITAAAKYTVQKFSEAIFPWKYIKGLESQKKIMNYCQSNLAPEVHLLDVGHNIGEVVQATAGSLRVLKNNLHRSVEDIFTEYAPTPQVPRIATKASTFNGMLSYPTTPGETVFILQIAKAAAETKDIWFTFGTGTSQRSCVFKDFFLNFMQDLQQELRKEE